MNFAAARQLIGQKDPKNPQYDAKASMLATFGEGTGQISFNQNQKQECKCKLTDDAGETHNVILRGNTLPDAQWLGRRGSFLISAYQGNYQGKPYTGYSGFWNNNAQVAQQPVSATPQPPQGYPPPQTPNPTPPPATAPQAANAKPETDWNAKDLREFRSHKIHDATNIVVALAQVNNDARGMSPELVIQISETFVKYVYNGREAVPNTQGQPPVDDDDIPF